MFDRLRMYANLQDLTQLWNLGWLNVLAKVLLCLGKINHSVLLFKAPTFTVYVQNIGETN